MFKTHLEKNMSELDVLPQAKQNNALPLPYSLSFLPKLELPREKSNFISRSRNTYNAFVTCTVETYQGCQTQVLLRKDAH